jgi:UMF1 family MFS transporter
MYAGALSHDAQSRRAARAVAAWCLYDWANSPFTTLVVTFVYGTYFSKAFAPDEASGTALWSRGIVVSSVIVALLSPILGAAVDRNGTRRRSLIVATLVCVAATAALAFVSPAAPHAALLVLAVFVTANVAFEIGCVFYNAFLPSLAPAGAIGRISGYGWALGYAGGLACLVAGLLFFVGLSGPGLLGLSEADGFHVRATNLLVAGWFLVFSVPTFVWVRDTEPGTGRLGVRASIAELGRTWLRMRGYPQVVRFLLARLIYNDGLVTIFAFGGIYAAGTLGMAFDEILLFGIAINVTAGLGAWAFGFLDDRAGARATILLSLLALSAATLAAVLAPSKTAFWVAGLVLGIFAGPTQSASRSLMGRFVPPRHHTEFFGFYAFSGKATAFAGPLLLGIFTQLHGQRTGMATVLGFFLAGGVLLLSVNEREGIEAARR